MIDLIMADVAKQAELDFSFIQRNVRDLAVTAQFSNMKELEELHQLAYKNLKNQMDEGKPLSVDPSLVLETYRTISSVAMQTVEVKRKAAETLMKSRTLIDVPPVRAERDNDLLKEGDAFDEDISKASISHSSGAGLYGGLVGSNEGDPDVEV